MGVSREFVEQTVAERQAVAARLAEDLGRAIAACGLGADSYGYWVFKDVCGLEPDVKVYWRRDGDSGFVPSADEASAFKVMVYRGSVHH